MMPRVLVVDDDVLARRYAQSVLEENGYTVVTATEGFEALRLIEQGSAFDLFMLDVVMPQMTGAELARHVRQANADAKILYVTGYSDQLFTDKGVLWEGEAFIEKPVTPEGLLQAVRLLLDETDPP